MSQYAVDLAVLPGRQRTPSVTGVSSLRQRPSPSGVAEGVTSPPLIGPNGTIMVAQPEISHEGEDLVYEVLAINTLAMQRCKTEEWAGAMTMLNEAYAKLNADGVDRVIEAPQLLDQLRGTTLNNMGVVECHRAKPRQALSHFESARQMEENWNMSSPSVALNTCAAYNALGMYDKATAAALETIEMLRTLELQRTRAKKLAAAAPPADATATGVCSRSIAFPPMNSATPEQKEEEDDMLKAATSPQIADSDNRALWGAAWHNLAVAQLNTSRDAPPREISEYTNALTVFQNAMRATQAQLGCQHPLTKAITDTYRDVRRALHQKGAFRQHHTLMTVPPLPADPREQDYADMLVEPLPGKTIRGTIEKKRHDLTITFRGEATGGAKLVERIDPLPYPGAKDEVYQSKGTYHSGDLAKTSKRSRKALSRIPLSRALSRAAQVYSNPHPLLYTQPPAAENPAAMTGHSDFGGTVPTWGSHHALPPQSASEYHPSRPFDSTYSGSSSPAAVCRPPQDPMPLSGRLRPGGTTRQRPSPPPRTRGHRRGPSSADPQAGGRPPHGAKKAHLPAIPPPHRGSSVGSWQHGGDAPAGGRGYRAVHQQDPQSMPPPPPAQQQWRYQPPAPYAYPPSGELIGYHGTAPINTHFDQSKLLLLAQPPLVTASTRTTYFPVELPEPESVPPPPADRVSLDYVGPRVAERGGKEASSQKRGSHAGEGPTFSHAHPIRKLQEHRRRSSLSWSLAKGHPSANSRPAALQETASGTDGQSGEQPPPRELFNAMWVTADSDYVQYSRDVRGLARDTTAGGTGAPVPIAMHIEEDGLPTHRYGPAPPLDGEESQQKGSGVGGPNASMTGSVGSPMFVYTSSTSTEDAANTTVDVLAGTSAPLS